MACSTARLARRAIRPMTSFSPDTANSPVSAARSNRSRDIRPVRRARATIAASSSTSRASPAPATRRRASITGSGGFVGPRKGAAEASAIFQPLPELGDASLERRDDLDHLLAVVAGGDDVRQPPGLRQPFLAVVAIGDRDFDIGLLRFDPVIAFGANGVDPGPPGFLDVAPAKL